MADQYYEPEIYENSEKWLITIHRPILTEEERARRMQLIYNSAAALLKKKEGWN